MGAVFGFGGGFYVAQAIYSNEKERAQVKKVAKITGGVTAGLLLMGLIGSAMRR